ncbi:Butyrate kinase [Anaerovirgula multivorans]|uniref:Butyrate kinase n=1 Tax=Anaerovirgula multivorans TaxID=312168 RepID=UPI0011313B6A|nr:Butyrate kinase [Anaerovirgula multivorans]
MREYILVINPGSTSTKVSLFKEEENIYEKKLNHSPTELEEFTKITDQYELRKSIILK